MVATCQPQPGPAGCLPTTRPGPGPLATSFPARDADAPSDRVASPWPPPRHVGAAGQAYSEPGRPPGRPHPSPLQQLKSLLPAVGLHPHSKPRQPCMPATLSPRQPIPGLGSAVPTWAAPPAPSMPHSHILGDRGVADSVCCGRDAGLAAIAAAAAVQAGHVDAVEAVVCRPRPWGGLLPPILIRAPAGRDPAQLQALA